MANAEAKRADAVLRIAQIKFKQLLKNEAEGPLPPVAPDASAHFCDALDAVLQQNTPANVQVSI